jgi:hypothetical protein
MVPNHLRQLRNIEFFVRNIFTKFVNVFLKGGNVFGLRSDARVYDVDVGFVLQLDKQFFCSGIGCRLFLAKLLNAGLKSVPLELPLLRGLARIRKRFLILGNRAVDLAQKRLKSLFLVRDLGELLVETGNHGHLFLKRRHRPLHFIQLGLLLLEAPRLRRKSLQIRLDLLLLVLDIINLLL